jgi:hypothetical protein
LASKSEDLAGAASHCSEWPFLAPDRGLELYVKFTSDTVTEFKLLSFKER